MAVNQAEPRLVISKMVLENFKSYAGAQHVGPFHKVGTEIVGCSACVGPSAKSRVLPAVLHLCSRP